MAGTFFVRCLDAVTFVATILVMATIEIIEQTIYSDGSGVSGLYQVYGARFAGSRNPEGGVRVFALGIPSRRLARKTKGVIASAAKAVERHLRALEVPVWLGD